MMLEYTYPPLSGPNRNRNRTRSRYSQGLQVSPSLTLYPPPFYTSVSFIITFISRGECGRNRGKWSIFEPFFYHLLIKGKTLIYICGLSFQQLNFLTGIYIYIYRVFTVYFLLLSFFHVRILCAAFLVAFFRPTLFLGISERFFLSLFFFFFFFYIFGTGSFCLVFLGGLFHI